MNLSGPDWLLRLRGALGLLGLDDALLGRRLLLRSHAVGGHRHPERHAKHGREGVAETAEAIARIGEFHDLGVLEQALEPFRKFRDLDLAVLGALHQEAHVRELVGTRPIPFQLRRHLPVRERDDRRADLLVDQPEVGVAHRRLCGEVGALLGTGHLEVLGLLQAFLALEIALHHAAEEFVEEPEVLVDRLRHPLGQSEPLVEERPDRQEPTEFAELVDLARELADRLQDLDVLAVALHEHHATEVTGASGRLVRDAHAHLAGHARGDLLDADAGSGLAHDAPDLLHELIRGGLFRLRDLRLQKSLESVLESVGAVDAIRLAVQPDACRALLGELLQGLLGQFVEEAQTDQAGQALTIHQHRPDQRGHDGPARRRRLADHRQRVGVLRRDLRDGMLGADRRVDRLADLLELLEVGAPTHLVPLEAEPGLLEVDVHRFADLVDERADLLLGLLLLLDRLHADEFRDSQALVRHTPSVYKPTMGHTLFGLAQNPKGSG